MGKQGSSAVHDESSRSHVFLEMELVTKQLIEARTALWNAEAEIVPIGREYGDHIINNTMFTNGAVSYDKETKEFVVNEEWKEDKAVTRKVDAMTDEMLRLSVKITGCARWCWTTTGPSGAASASRSASASTVSDEHFVFCGERVCILICEWFV